VSAMASVDTLGNQEGHKEVPAVHRAIPMGDREIREVSDVCAEGKAAPVVWGDAVAGKATGKTNIKCSFSA
jgi:hypothetical protein